MNIISVAIGEQFRMQSSRKAVSFKEQTMSEDKSISL